MNRQPGVSQKSLILRCMPFIEKGVGSAWGLPVISSGKEHLSALSLSEKLQAPGIVSFGADPFREEHLRELETLGIGPLGRYLGGEPIKPIRLGPKDFFCTDIARPQAFGRLEKNDTANAAALFCRGLEFADTYWIAEAPPPELFKGHLEFLRIWGFNGGIAIDETMLAHQLTEYILFLQKETSREKPVIIVLVSKHFFETQLGAQLPISILKEEVPELSFAYFEELDTMLRVQKIRCDILLVINTGTLKNQRSNSVYAEEITSRLTFIISTSGLDKKNPGAKKERSLNDYLFRSCKEALPFPENRKTENSVRLIEKEYSCSFTINSKFSGLRAADFKEEQALFYAHTAKENKTPPAEQAPPPIRNNAPFFGLNETQLKFFIQWRNECRRGNIQIMPGSMYIETYIVLYAEELVLCMGKEGPIQHFTALMQLYHACAEYYPETANRLCKYCVDFAVIYGIDKEVFPILLNELISNGWFNGEHTETGDTEYVLIDLAICHFFIETEHNTEKTEYWPLLKKLIPPRILKRKENDKELPSLFCRTLGILDAQLCRDWNRPFFTLFFPTQPQSSDCTAFESNRYLGKSSYTVLRPGFSTHKPLLDILAVLTLRPEQNPLPEVKARLHPLSLESQLIEALRKESDEVREMLTLEEYSVYEQTSKYKTHISPTGKKRIEHCPKDLNGPAISEYSYKPVQESALFEFIASMEPAHRTALNTIIQAANNSAIKPAVFPDTVIDEINAAFYERFGDLLLETSCEGHSISEEYAVILRTWE